MGFENVHVVFWGWHVIVPHLKYELAPPTMCAPFVGGGCQTHGPTATLTFIVCFFAKAMQWHASTGQFDTAMQKPLRGRCVLYAQERQNMQEPEAVEAGKVTFRPKQAPVRSALSLSTFCLLGCFTDEDCLCTHHCSADPRRKVTRMVPYHSSDTRMHSGTSGAASYRPSLPTFSVLQVPWSGSMGRPNR